MNKWNIHCILKSKKTEKAVHFLGELIPNNLKIIMLIVIIIIITIIVIVMELRKPGHITSKYSYIFFFFPTGIIVRKNISSHRTSL